MARTRVEQADPSTWPAFQGVELRGAGLVSVVARRGLDGTLDEAAAAALGLAVRCHGAFDDPEVVCDVVGETSAVARLTAALHRRSAG
ncbi:hypothetical protein [Cellulomonas cellasea]|uniref:Uncharacterized protein n=1 Tax=Cellulomonas cellasea TaxID=43670 RepID=A0A7W4YB65_9CELL|nr:hypothetical protein [Cellulomonas cellasea]MBB2923575.1 hypothetical protein [Cellulomonas cellasea]